jgi:hypothetical protein
MFVQCHKTEWVKMAIQLNNSINKYTNCEYTWIDFGIFHMFKNEEIFKDCIEQLQTRISNKENKKVRAGSCWQITDYTKHNIDIYRKISWVFAGSIFGGPAEELLIFADLTKEKCLKIINELNHIMWEVNVWAIINNEKPELFDLYYCGHDKTIIKNY